MGKASRRAPAQPRPPAQGIAVRRHIRYIVEAEIEEQPVDQTWMSLVLRWLQTWQFTQAQADHLIVIIKGQVRPSLAPQQEHEK